MSSSSFRAVPDDALDLKAACAEVEQQSPPETRDAEIVDHLRMIDWLKRRERFEFHNDFAVAKEVYDVSGRHHPALVANPKGAFALERDATRQQLERNGSR